MANKYWSIEPSEVNPENFRKVLDKVEKNVRFLPDPVTEPERLVHEETVLCVKAIRAARLAFHNFKCV
ncbi:MAG: hypothetical protein IMZ71_01380 [Chloroflexi bacterium]|nr:hypothetical protein [Chloroflexota bacterium]